MKMAAAFAFADLLAKITHYYQKNAIEKNLKNIQELSDGIGVPLHFLTQIYPAAPQNTQMPSCTNVDISTKPVRSHPAEGTQSKLASPTCKTLKPNHGLISGSTESSSSAASSSKDLFINESVTHKPRKLKLYTVDEKLDIIDYAKVVGNRAAGREFGVAESSIREWRKNEDKLRQQADTNPKDIGRHIELKNPQMIRCIDNTLVDFIISNVDNVDWHIIAEQAKKAYQEINNNALEVSTVSPNFTMGWISRFMRRNEKVLPKIPPPIISNGNANSDQASLVSDQLKEITLPQKRRNPYTKHSRRTTKRPKKCTISKDDIETASTVFQDKKEKSKKNRGEEHQLHFEEANQQGIIKLDSEKPSRRKPKNPKRFDPNLVTFDHMCIDSGF